MQKKIKVIISCLLIVLVFTTALTGCNSSKKDVVNNKLPEVVNTALLRDPDNFYQEFQNYILTSDIEDENYVVSPVALRSAMAFYANAATDDTQKEILLTMGFGTLDEYNKWYKDIKSFASNYSANNNSDISHVANLNIVNVFKSPDAAMSDDEKELSFTSEFLNNIKDLGISYEKCAMSDIANKINEAVAKNTNSQVKNIINKDYNIHSGSLIAANTVYLKSDWQIPFTYIDNYNGSFTAKTGEKVEKEYMKVLSYYNYYKDKNTELVVVPLQNNVYCAFVVGDATNIYNKITKSVQQEVLLTVPKSNIEFDVPKDLLLNYFNVKDASSVLINSGNFHTATDQALMLDDLVQKNKININENGVETAPATLITSVGGTATDYCVKFTINKSYHFFIYNQPTEDTYNTLLMGQVCQ